MYSRLVAPPHSEAIRRALNVSESQKSSKSTFQKEDSSVSGVDDAHQWCVAGRAGRPSRRRGPSAESSQPEACRPRDNSGGDEIDPLVAEPCLIEVAKVARVRGCRRDTLATVAIREKWVATRKPLMEKSTGHPSHRGHRKRKDIRNPMFWRSPKRQKGRA
jgi:hypothetical protein